MSPEYRLWHFFTPSTRWKTQPMGNGHELFTFCTNALTTGNPFILGISIGRGIGALNGLAQQIGSCVGGEDPPKRGASI